jgi:DNA-binding transcriptional LysR family regulator
LYIDLVVDLIDEGLDVAVRIAHLPDPSLTARVFSRSVPDVRLV